MWLSAIKLAVSTGSKIYANKQRQKRQYTGSTSYCRKNGSGEREYEGKLLEARQNDYKDEFVLLILSAPIVVLLGSFVTTLL